MYRLLFESALERASIKPEQMNYIEAHGTGTKLGDPIEINSLTSVYGESRDPPLLIGSVKANIGHTESAAGVAGLIKIILCLQKRIIPKQIHFSELNPEVAAPKSVLIPKMTLVLPSTDILYAGVSSFGFTGTNSHIIISEPPKYNSGNAESRRYNILTVSAKTKKALEEYCSLWNAKISEENVSVEDLCYTSNVGRTHWKEHRAAVVVTKGKTEKLRILDKKNRLGGIGFLFTGQGSQYSGMATMFYETENVFRGMFDNCVNRFSAILK